MVTLSQVQTSNSHIAADLPSGLVAVFVGATSGIGEFTLKRFAHHAKSPRVYFIGRSQSSADRISAECTSINPSGTYAFLQADTSLLANVDDVCRTITKRESALNLLFLSTGTLLAGTETSEGLHTPAALAYYARARFTTNLLPLLRRGEGLRRVVNVLAGGYEGAVDEANWQGWKLSPLAARGQGCSMLTLSLEEMARRAPGVGFVHSYPGYVQTNIARDVGGIVWTIIKVLAKVIGGWFSVPAEESGERHVFLLTSARFPGRDESGDENGVRLEGQMVTAEGTEGTGSGVYTVGATSESSVAPALAKTRDQGMRDKVWQHTEEQFKRITGTVEVA